MERHPRCGRRGVVHERGVEAHHGRIFAFHLVVAEQRRHRGGEGSSSLERRGAQRGLRVFIAARRVDTRLGAGRCDGARVVRALDRRVRPRHRRAGGVARGRRLHGARGRGREHGRAGSGGPRAPGALDGWGDRRRSWGSADGGVGRPRCAGGGTGRGGVRRGSGCRWGARASPRRGRQLRPAPEGDGVRARYRLTASRRRGRLREPLRHAGCHLGQLESALELLVIGRCARRATEPPQRVLEISVLPARRRHREGALHVLDVVSARLGDGGRLCCHRDRYLQAARFCRSRATDHAWPSMGLPCPLEKSDENGSNAALLLRSM